MVLRVYLPYFLIACYCAQYYHEIGVEFYFQSDPESHFRMKSSVKPVLFLSMFIHRFLALGAAAAYRYLPGQSFYLAYLSPRPACSHLHSPADIRICVESWGKAQRVFYQMEFSSFRLHTAELSYNGCGSCWSPVEPTCLRRRQVSPHSINKQCYSILPTLDSPSRLIYGTELMLYSLLAGSVVSLMTCVESWWASHQQGEGELIAGGQLPYHAFSYLVPQQQYSGLALVFMSYCAPSDEAFFLRVSYTELILTTVFLLFRLFNLLADNKLQRDNLCLQSSRYTIGVYLS